jgi:GH25 family lysozyme M1 (1,4-beta-N-acetylmuramidase)
MFLGIDISVHNGNVNVQQVKDAGYQYIIIRAGYGKNNIDQKFELNASACVNLAMPMGIYWFSYAYTVDMARQEAKYAIEAIKKYKSVCPVAYDLEYDSVRYARTKGVEITRSLATDMAKAFLEEVENASYFPILYTNYDYEKNYFDMNQLNCDIWYARYRSSISAAEKEHASIWQKSNTGKVPGITDNVDINEFYIDFDNLDAETEDEIEIISNINILNFQKAANTDGYRDAKGRKLAEDGIDGVNTRYVHKNVILKARRTLLFFYRTGSTGELVIWWQSRLNEMGFITRIDGKFGRDSRKKTRQMQKKYNLKIDGIAGYNSISAAFYN